MENRVELLKKAISTPEKTVCTVEPRPKPPLPSITQPENGARFFWKDQELTEQQFVIQGFRFIYDFPEVFDSKSDLLYMEHLKSIGWSKSRILEMRLWAIQNSKFSRPYWVIAKLESLGIKTEKVKEFAR